MGWVNLQCGAQVLRVDGSICEMARERVHWESFLATSGEPPALTISRRSAVDGLAIDAPLGQCTVRVEGPSLDVAIEDGVFRGELVLRLAWYLLTARQGGVLIHACGLKYGSSAVIAAGKSGDGKSTLSRLGIAAGLELLSDEVMQLFPDGRVSGTPFRSDVEQPGRPGLVQAKYFCALEKAPHEALRPLSALAAVGLAAAQCQEVGQMAIPRDETRRRLLGFLSQVEPRLFAFRKDPAAGEALKEWLTPP